MIDLSPLNGFVRQTPFRMETVASVMASIREGDFMASVDLKDVYRHPSPTAASPFANSFICD